ncbi:mechanosensitive ion channel protein 10-like [Spinacia oleracea]|uniref:Mechanosensitive ion channel protein n=1 Tax=Spinacia oleracea TaxID=3562 RepID=A0ABM3R7N0_SPIOL|nr:mechanosensitive ion channel protein 10-like [Spinacia oleracea]
MKERVTHDVVLSILNEVALEKSTEIPSEFTMINPIMSTPQTPPYFFLNELSRRRAAMASSAFSKSKSRFFEPPYPSYDMVSSNTFHTQQKDEENDEDVYRSIDHLQPDHLPFRKKLNFFVLVEISVLISLMGLFITSLIDYNLQDTTLWNLELWKCCVLFTVILCGRLVTKWFINILVYLVERKLHFTKKAPYFVNGLKKSVRVFLWFSFVLLAWILLVVRGSNNRSRKAKEVLHCITMAITGCIFGVVIWILKTLLIESLALCFHVKRFFDRIQDSLYDQYVLQILSGSRNVSQLSLDKGLKEEVINVKKLRVTNQENVSAWTMKGLINVVRKTKLSIISDRIEFGEDDNIVEQNKEIKTEWQAKVAAVKIFKNVAKPGYEYIEEEDLLRFMKMDEINKVIPLVDGFTETGKIKELALEKWVVNAYLERKSLAHSLDDTKTAVDKLNILASGVVLIVNVIVWNLIMGFLSTKILIFVTTQLLLAAFMFGNSVKTVFEAIIFVFVMHPFDVGDRCVIDGVQMTVEEMNILTTLFLRYDNEKISYPNSVLATKPISNFYRSPEMNDSVEFAINFSTTVEAIAALKDRIKSYIESKPQHWRPCHSVQMKDIVDMNKIKMTLYVTHTINFQNITEKNSRTSDLVLELKKAFEELGIRYHLLPQEVHVTYTSTC